MRKALHLDYPISCCVVKAPAQISKVGPLSWITSCIPFTSKSSVQPNQALPLNMCIFGVYSWSSPNHMPLKYKCSIKIGNQIRHVYLNI